MKKLILVIAIMMTTFLAYAQIEATTAAGKKVVLHSDGTWEYIKNAASEDDAFSKPANCDSLVSTSTDKVTGKILTSNRSTFYIWGVRGSSRTKININFLKVAGSDEFIALQIFARGNNISNCIASDGTMNILFRDGTRLEQNNSGGFNCDSEYMQVLDNEPGGSNPILKKLATTEIETLRIYTTKEYVQKDLTPEESKMFKDILQCLVN